MSIILTQRDQALVFMSPIPDIIFKYKGFLRCCIPDVFTLEEMEHAVYCPNPSSSNYKVLWLSTVIVSLL